MRTSVLWALILFFIPSISLAYLNEQTNSLVKTKRLSRHQQVDLNESIDEDGVIRKVSWQGMHHPDLKNLLGPCFSHYEDYVTNTKFLRLRGAITIDRGGCHISIGGHMRSVHGEASLDK